MSGRTRSVLLTLFLIVLALLLATWLLRVISGLFSSLIFGAVIVLGILVLVKILSSRRA